VVVGEEDAVEVEAAVGTNGIQRVHISNVRTKAETIQYFNRYVTGVSCRPSCVPSASV
jgi:hypothetical protein